MPLITWAGVDPVRTDAAAVTLGDRVLHAHGSSTSADFALSYALVTQEEWVTRALDVTAVGNGWRRSLELRHNGSGVWSAAWQGDGVDGFALPELSAALDCDLGFCPLTNSMPVLRHGMLETRQGDERDFVMAWVSVPDLAVHVSRQTYRPLYPVDPDGAQIEYRSERFRTVLEFDRDGLVRTYPGLAYRR